MKKTIHPTVGSVWISVVDLPKAGRVIVLVKIAGEKSLVRSIPLMPEGKEVSDEILSSSQDNIIEFMDSILSEIDARSQ